VKPTSVAFHHFGCKVNFAEASSISRDFKQKGFELKDHHEIADIYVISTCVVTQVAEKKCRAAIHHAHKLNPDAKIAVIGCFSELKPGDLQKIEGVDLVLGNSDKFRLLDELEKLTKTGNGMSNSEAAKSASPNQIIPHPASRIPHPVSSIQHPPTTDHQPLTTNNQPDRYHFIPSFSYGDRTRSFLKIQDGCDYYCSYCTIPLARGHSRSDSIEHIISSVREIVNQGIKEVVLTGVNIGDFGRNSGETFLQLVQALNTIEELPRIRISSIEPDLLSDEIISLMASSKHFMPHFHLPLQSGSDSVLKDMKRKYNTAMYAGRVARIKELIPHACVASDVIVGFPSESHENFQETYDFLKSLPVSYMHVFTYSKRENTLASKVRNLVSDKEKKDRSRQLHLLSEEKKRIFYLENRGRDAEVLFESDNSEGWMHGFSENYIKVKAPFDPSLSNSIRTVTLKNLDENGIFVWPGH
jgi:threonylcarbamoyladenosine tRNA methylthiotransferase MtaB